MSMLMWSKFQKNFNSVIIKGWNYRNGKRCIQRIWISKKILILIIHFKVTGTQSQFTTFLETTVTQNLVEQIWWKYFYPFRKGLNFLPLKKWTHSDHPFARYWAKTNRGGRICPPPVDLGLSYFPRS